MLDAFCVALALTGPAPVAPAIHATAAGAEPGVVVREGHPADGLAWRLHLPAAASAASPAKVIVWLHPAGGRSFNAEAEALVPLLARAGHALLVPIEKDYALWTGDDALRLLRGTLPDLKSVPEVDASRPILFGFSGGGQLALELFHGAPRSFAGLILDAAYPVVDSPEGARPRPEPPGEAARGARVFVVVGADDPVAKVWDAAADPWRAGGIDLTMVTVAGHGHEWLFTKPAVVDALAAWLGPPATPPEPAAPPEPPRPVR